MKFKMLRMRMLDAEMSCAEVAKAAGICPSAFSKRLNGRLPFTAPEMRRIGERLRIPPEQYCNYFFDVRSAE